MLFTLTYRQNLVQTTLIEAKNFKRAYKVAERYCASLPAARVVNVKPAVSADESLLHAEEWEEFERAEQARAAAKAGPAERGKKTA